MKILNAQQIHALDAYTMTHEPISSIDLMERASEAFVSWFVKKFTTATPIAIFAGTGNNGGDGLAIGRMLKEQGYGAEVFLIEISKHVPNVSINLERLQGNFTSIASATDLPSLPKDAIVIDAIFGIGLSRPAEGLAKAAIQHINASGCCVVAVDIASGLYCDAPRLDATIVKPTYTITFEAPKLAFMLPENEAFVCEWHALPIGLHADAMRDADTSYYYVDPLFARQLLRTRSTFAHKGTFGHALMVAGMKGKMGAAFLAAKAVLRTGAGLLSVHVPQCGLLPMQTGLPEAICSVDSHADCFSEAPNLGKYQAVGVGPGLGQSAETATGLEQLMEKISLEKAACPAVFDADALNLIAAHTALSSSLPPFSVLTPHPKEFERLAGITANHYERLARLVDYCYDQQVYVVLKGAYTAIGTPDREVFFNSTGNPGMATAGSGDVLTGMITSLLAQGYSTKNACILGVYLHGLAGDIAADALGQEALMASDIIEHISKAYQALK